MSTASTNDKATLLTLKKRLTEPDRDLMAIVNSLSTINMDKQLLKETMIGKALNKAANAGETTPRAKKAAKDLMGVWKKKIDYKPSSSGHHHSRPKSASGESTTPNSSKVENTKPVATADASTTDGSCTSSSGNTDLTSVMEVARCGDPKRDKIRNLLFKALRPRRNPEEAEPAVRAVEIEEECHSKLSEREYLSQIRSIKYNLTDSSNPDFQWKVLVGVFPRDKYSLLTSEDMASEAKNQHRASAAKAALEECQSDWAMRHGAIQKSGMFQCGKCKKSQTTADGPVILDRWVKENEGSFAPPFCNRVMHRDDLVIMFVSGPNMRNDFHLDESPEFFWQMRGNMELPIIERGQRKLVKINEGEVFLLPPRIPHAPQRPDQGSLGLVIERQRIEGQDYDGLRWYTDFTKCDKVLWERYFYCGNLEKDVIPVVKEYQDSDEFANKTPSARSVPASVPFKEDTTTTVPRDLIFAVKHFVRPFPLDEWLKAHSKELAIPGTKLNLFGDDYPTKEFIIYILGAGSSTAVYEEVTGESVAFIYVIHGSLEIMYDKSARVGVTGACMMLPGQTTTNIKRSEDCIALLLKSRRR
ncbi:hypothetical protein FOL47_004595 [Perkinsus chesapeaki]|uniref:3-hydroxyanthranilate 3,4-dioxygenase n=1 Tax=Perkinsus chesapeaki TaxID=330153 RepID=A0A7J6MZ30_PERCH|nr:hypothetical protein FOL47_004595 [Perkinsus chesapeaki]